MTLAGLLASGDAAADEVLRGWQHDRVRLRHGRGSSTATAQIGPVKVDVDASMSDVFDALEFGAMLAYRVENGTWSFMGDATYMGLGAHDTHEHVQAAAR